MRAVIDKEWLGVPRLLWYVIGIVFLVTVCGSVARWSFFLMDGYDLGIFDQVIWNSSQGRLFTYSFNDYLYLVDHRSWLLLLFVPVYWIAAHPLVLLVIQIAAVVSGAIPLYFMARKVSGKRSQWFAFVAALVFLLHPLVHQLLLTEFHMLALSVPIALWLWLAVLQKRWRWVWVLAIVLLLLRDDLSLVVAGIGLVLLLRRWDASVRVAASRMGVALLVVSIVWFVAMSYVGSSLSPLDGAKFLALYEWAGSSAGEIIGTIVTQPGQALSVLFGHDHVVVLLLLLASVFFLPLRRSLLLLPAGIPLGLLLFIDRPLLHVLLTSHYLAFALPWLAIAMIEGAHTVLQSRKRPTSPSVLIIIGTLLLLWHLVAIGPWYQLVQEVQGRGLESRAQFVESVEMIGDDDRVLATPRIHSHLGRREELYTTVQMATGTHHFSDKQYTFDKTVDWIALERDELAKYRLILTPEEHLQFLLQMHKAVEASNLHVVVANEEVFLFGPQQVAQADVSEFKTLQQWLQGALQAERVEQPLLPLQQPRAQFTPFQ